MNCSPYSAAALRRGAWQYSTGKAATALLSFIILILLVRLLPIAEYGAYIMLVAGVELGTAIAGLGLPWLAARYLPEYRLYASGAALMGLCRRLLIWQTLSLLALSVIFAVFLDSYLSWAELESFRVPTQVYLIVILVEGLGRFLRESLMGPLMQQGEMRLSIVLRQLCFLVIIATPSFTSQSPLFWVVWAELVASTLGMVIAFFFLWRYLRSRRDQTSQLGWSAPGLATQWHIAGRMYTAHLLTLFYGPQAFVNLIQHALGVEAAALFGFLRNLQDQISRYLPATLMFSLIRPKLIASYVGGGGMSELSRNANMAGKLSLFALMPLILFAIFSGDPLVAWLSDDKFTRSGWLLFGFMLVLVPVSQRLLIESVAVASGHSGLCTVGAASGLIMLPFMWVMLQFGLGLWAGVIAIGLGHLLFNIVVVSGISKQTEYQIDWMGFSKLTVSALIAYLASLLPYHEYIDTLDLPWESILLQCVLATLVYLTAAWWIKSFATDECDRIRTLLKWRITVQ